MTFGSVLVANRFARLVFAREWPHVLAKVTAGAYWLVRISPVVRFAAPASVSKLITVAAGVNAPTPTSGRADAAPAAARSPIAAITILMCLSSPAAQADARRLADSRRKSPVSV